MDNIVYQWLEEPVEFEPNLELPQFRLVDTDRADCSQNYTTGKTYLSVFIPNI